MDFAKNILQKYGWKEGDGLGKNADGITVPIKASLKFSTSGLGAAPAKDLTDNWWERVYNDAAGNVQVQSGSNNAQGSQLSVRQADAVEISTKSYSVKKLQEQGKDGTKYGSTFLKASITFLKASMLSATGGEHEMADRINMEEIEFKPTETLTDEQLFAACGGRTAHKGARHGLTLNGKLARIDEQNNKLLQKLEHEKFEAVMKTNEWQVQHSRNGRKRSKKQKRNDQKWFERASVGTVDDEVKDMVHHADYVVAKNRKKKKALKQTDNDLANCVTTMFSVLPEDDGIEEDVEPPPSLDDELDQLSEKIRKLDHSSVTIKKRDRKNKKKLKRAVTGGSNADDADDIAMNDPAAKYRKDYRPDLKRNNRLLKSRVSHEVPEEKLPTKPVSLMRSGSSDGSDDEEDVVKKVNEEQDRYWRKMRANVPKINIIEPTEDDCLALAQGLKERHQNEVKRVGKHRLNVKKKKSKKKQRQVAQLADSLSKNL
ncbi:AGAP004490-PA-like protein [Anopheles sinensis]|uniref:G patch domain-containing protein 4 n=1 Tax=Anopheles sinensis TaxID=74873 RepID=A0A084WA07_ANOSI|nr:AGAP004490-PA-like protein [Anopheles sinensis]